MVVEFCTAVFQLNRVPFNFISSFAKVHHLKGSKLATHLLKNIICLFIMIIMDLNITYT